MNISISTLFCLFTSFQPNSSFLTDAATLATAIAAIAVPLGTSLINSLGERYGSPAVSEAFGRKLSFRLIRALWVITLPLSLVARFFVPPGALSEWWVVFLWVLLLLTLSLVVLLAWFSGTILQYASDTSRVVSGNLVARTRRFIGFRLWLHALTQSVQRFCGRMIPRRKSDAVSSKQSSGHDLDRWLNRREGMWHHIIRRRREKSQYRIEHLLSGLESVVSYDTQRLRSALPTSVIHDVETICREILSRNSESPISHSSLTAWIDQLGRIRHAATVASNREIEEKAAQSMVSLLVAAVQENGWFDFVDGTARKMWTAVAQDHPTSPKSRCRLYIGWYFAAMSLRDYDNPTIKIRNCRPEYFECLNQHLRESLNHLVAQNSEEHDAVFRAWVAESVGFPLSIRLEDDLRRVGSILLRHDHKIATRLYKDGLGHQIESLTRRALVADNAKQLAEWVQQFKQLKQSIQSSLSSDTTRSEVKKWATEVRHCADHRVRFNGLVKVGFEIGAYCLFKSRPELICAMWEYKNPPDADAFIVNAKPLVHESCESLTTFYFSSQLWDESLWWEGHHGSRQYVERYYLLRLAWLLRSHAAKVKAARANAQPLPQLPGGGLHHLSFNGDTSFGTLHTIEPLVRDLMSIVDQLKQDVQLHQGLGFDTTSVVAVYDESVIPFLKNLVSDAERRMLVILAETSIPEMKIMEFRKHVFETYQRFCKMSDLYRLGFLSGDVEQSDVNISESVIERVFQPRPVSKMNFLVGWESWLKTEAECAGESIAHDENKQIVDLLISRSILIDIATSVRDLVDRFDSREHLIILASAELVWQLFAYDRATPVELADLGLDDGMIETMYRYDGVSIPVLTFEAFGRGVLVLDRTVAGTFTRYPAVDESDNPDCIGHLGVSVVSLSDDCNQLQRCLEAQMTGSVGHTADELRMELRAQVVIRVWQRFAFEIGSDYQAFCWYLPSGSPIS